MPECCQCGQDSEKIAELVVQLRALATTLREISRKHARDLYSPASYLFATAGAIQHEVDQISPPPEEPEPYDREKCWHTKTPFKVSTHGSLHR